MCRVYAEQKHGGRLRGPCGYSLIFSELNFATSRVPLVITLQVRDVLKGNVSLGCVLDSETPSASSSVNGTAPCEPREEEEVLSECSGPEPQKDSLCPVAAAPVISQADMETLNLFQDIAAEPSAGTLRRQQVAGAQKQKDFNDPLSSLLSEVEESLPDFLRK